MVDETDKLEIPVTKLQWGLRGAQAFFALIAMFTISAVIGWDNKFFSASLFSVFFLFILLLSIFFAIAIVVIPHLYITKGKFTDAARALRIPRIEFVLSAIWAVLIFIVTFLLTIDAYVLRKCDPNDPKYDDFTSGSSNETFFTGLPKICKTQRAANAFGWFALTAWLCSLVLIANDWRKNRRQPVSQGPITYHHKPSNTSISSSVDEHGLPDTSTQPTQEHVPMQTIHSTPYPPPQPPQPPQQQQQQFQPHPTFPQQQQTFSSPPLVPVSSPPPPSGISIPQPQFPGPGQGQGQGQGQSPGQGGISFPQPRYS